MRHITWNYLETENAVPLPKQWEDRKTFDIELPFEPMWFKQKEKILLVVDYVHNLDLKEGKLISAKPVATLWNNVINYSIRYANPTSDELLPYGYINLNYFKTYDLEYDARREANKYAAQRVIAFIKAYRPTRVASVGDECSKILFEALGVSDPYLLNKRGQVIQVTLDDHTFSLVNCFGPQNLLSDDGKIADNDAVVLHANLLGYCAHTLSSVWLNRRKYDISDIEIKPVVVDTTDKFKKLLVMLNDATDQGKPIAVDVETVGLGVYDNPILTIQFAFSDKRGFFLPLSHKNSPFTGKQLDGIVKRLRNWLARKDIGETYLIGHNMKFDLRILRQYFGVPHIYYPVFCTLSAQYCLDENQVGLRDFSTPAYGLSQCLASYGNYHYLTAAFSKSQRTTIASVDLTDDLIEYACADVQLAYALHLVQQKRASDMDFNGKPYGPYYKRLVTRLMSAIIHTMSQMEQRGTTIDLDYLMSQMEPNSPVNKIIKETEKEFANFDSVRIVNHRLVKQQGVPARGLFGNVDTQLFDITKVAHKQMLYFSVLELKPVTIGKSGDGSLGKAFQQEYKEIPEVAALTKLSKIKKLKSSYVDAFYDFVGKSHDGQKDSRLRAGFGFQDVVTGRSNSFKPSLQQIPEHGDFAKIIKRMFVAPEGQLIIKMDYAAHEIRCLHLDMLVDVEPLYNEYNKVRLGDLIEMENPPRVKSFNHATREIEYKPIGYKSKHTTEEQMLEIEYEGGSVWVTENHLVWSETRNMYIEARYIEEGEDILIDYG
jgi:DNA polymerase I-like protein with 3'-5' exonuclease and polymerase domains